MGLKDQDILNSIVKKCVKGDQKAQHELYKLFYSKMMGVCYRYAKNPEDAKDVLQDGFIKVFSNLKNYKFIGSLEGWIRRIMVNTAIDRLKKNKGIFFTENSEDQPAKSGNVASAEHIYSQFEVENIMKAIQSLSPAYQTVFNLYVIEGYQHKEIAEKLGINEGTSKSNLAKAKRNLQSILQKRDKNIDE